MGGQPKNEQNALAAFIEVTAQGGPYAFAEPDRGCFYVTPRKFGDSLNILATRVGWYAASIAAIARAEVLAAIRSPITLRSGEGGEGPPK